MNYFKKSHLHTRSERRFISDEFKHQFGGSSDEPVGPVVFAVNPRTKEAWWDATSGCYCVVCLAPVKEEFFVERNGCCGDCNFNDPCTYT
jgi:hypothetical protein